MDSESKLKLKSIFQSVFQLDSIENVEYLTKDNYIEWDSLAQLTLVSSIQEEFSTKIKAQDFIKFSSYESVCSILEEMGL